MSERMEYLDLLITVLQEHEKKLDEIIDTLEETVRTLSERQPNKTLRYEASECGKMYAQAILFIYEKGLGDEFKKWLKENQK